MRMRISSLSARPNRRAFCRAMAGAMAMSPQYGCKPPWFDFADLPLRGGLRNGCLVLGSSVVNDNTSVGLFLPRYARFHFAMSALETRQIVTAPAGIFRSLRTLVENFSRLSTEIRTWV